MGDFNTLMDLVRAFERKAEQYLVIMTDHRVSDEERAIAHGQHAAFRTASKDVWHAISATLAGARSKMEHA